MRIEGGMPEVCVHRDAIEQAILNLLSNAMKYSGDVPLIPLPVGRMLCNRVGMCLKAISNDTIPVQNAAAVEAQTLKSTYCPLSEAQG